MAFEMQPVKSSSGNHREFAYEPETQTLRVRYASGKSWDYHGVTKELFEASQAIPGGFGSYLQRIIVPSCPAAPVEEEDNASHSG